MPEEYWATCSIVDHRTLGFRQGLLLFDRLVVPVPSKPRFYFTQEELDRVSADVDYLCANEAAIRFDWEAHVIGEFRLKQPLWAEELSAIVKNHWREDLGFPIIRSGRFLCDIAEALIPKVGVRPAS